MPGERLSMRKIRELLRLRWEQQLPQRVLGKRIDTTLGRRSSAEPTRHRDNRGVHDHRNRCSRSAGIRVHNQLEQVFTIDRIQRSRSTGTRSPAAAAAYLPWLLRRPLVSGWCRSGALAAQPWQQGFFFALQANFVPLLGPADPMTYDPVQFYNSAVALLSEIASPCLGCGCLPPMSQTMRDRRLLALTLHDLRRLACGRLSLTVAEWDHKNFGRLSAMQGEAELLPAAQLAAGLSLGGEIIRLRRIADRFGLNAEFARAMAPIATATAPWRSANSTISIRRLPICRSQAPRHDTGCEDGG